MTIITPTGVTGINSITSSGNSLSFQNASGASIDVSGLKVAADSMNVSGIVTATGFVGNVTGNITGNLNSSGVSTVTTLRATSIVGVTTAGITTAYIGSVNDGPLSGARNRIINGDMRIDQRNAGTAVTLDNTGAYTLDRWYERCVGGAGSAVMTVQRSTVAPAGFTNSKLLTVTTSKSATASEQFWGFQAIEGNNVADFGLGTLSATAFTLSFWVRASVTGTYSVAFQNSAENRSYVATYTVNAADTFEYKTVTVSGDTTGTWITNNGVGMYVFFDTGSGSNFNTTAGAWTAGKYYRASGSVSLIANSGATFYITGVQLEAGTVATPFERRSYGQELLLCQRYFLRSNWVLCTSITGINYRKINPGPNVTMRTSPDHVYRHPVTKTVNQVREHSSGSTYTIDDSSSANSNGPSPTTYLGLSATPTYDVQVEIDYSAEL
jgi:hypothetical protein